MVLLLYLQKYLNEIGFNVGKVDCDFGEKTKSGVMKYQESKNLLVDGEVGNDTWKSLMQ